MRLAIVGSGGHARVVLALARALGYERIAVLDDAPGRIGADWEGLTVQGPVDEILAQDPNVVTIVAIGDGKARAALVSRIPNPFATLVHPFSWIAPETRIGEGSVVMAGAIVQPGVRVGRHAILNTGCSVDHDGLVGDFAHVAPGGRLAGGVTLCEGAHLGIGAAVVQGITLGAWSYVGAGAAVVRDVPEGALVKGVPAH